MTSVDSVSSSFHPLKLAKSVSELIRVAEHQLAQAGVDSARHDAEQLCAHVLSCERLRLITAEMPNEAQLAAFCDLVDQRAERVPLQYLLGRAHFAGLEMIVGPGVFIPRPETELLLELACAEIERLAAGPGDPASPDNSHAVTSSVVDLCSGSGALALALAHRYPGAEITAVESDDHGVRWLRRNAAMRVHNGDTPIAFRHGDAALASLTADLDGTVDVVVSNPPYVPSTSVVPPEVGEHEPPGAIFSGHDGMMLIPHLIVRAKELLVPGGLLVLEHDDCTGEAVSASIAKAGGFGSVEQHRDLTGRARFVAARRDGSVRAA